MLGAGRKRHGHQRGHKRKDSVGRHGFSSPLGV
jgi:hypothetical protein